MPSRDSNPSAPPRVTRRRRRIGCVVLLVLLAVGAGLLVRGYMLLQAPPPFWEQQRARMEQIPKLDLDRLAGTLELRAPREWTRPVGEGSGRRTLELGFDEINAWLAVRLDDWLANQGMDRPEGLGPAMVVERDGRIVLAARYESSAGTRVYSIAIQPRQNEEGQLLLQLDAVRGGRLELPSTQVIEQVRERVAIDAPALAAALDRFAAGQPAGPVVLPVGAHRQATLLEMRVNSRGFELDLLVEYDEEASQ